MRVLVDFNEVYDDNLIWAVYRPSTVTKGEDVQVGDWVELYDYDGTSCLGLVMEKGDSTIDCKIDWDTVEYVTTEVSPFHSLYDESVGYLFPGYLAKAR